jgi:hypothetical protein
MSDTEMMRPRVFTDALTDAVTNFQTFVGLEPTGAGTLKAVGLTWVVY